MFHIRLAERQRGLLEEFRQGAHQHAVAPSDAGGGHQGIEAVVFHPALPHGIKKREHIAAGAFLIDKVGAQAFGQRKAEMAQAHHFAAVAADAVGLFGIHRQAEVFDNGQGFRQAGACAVEIHFQPIRRSGVARLQAHAHGGVVLLIQNLNGADIFQRLGGAEIFTIARRKSLLIRAGLLGAQALLGGQLLPIAVPAAHHGVDVLLQRGGVEVGQGRGVGAEHKMQPCQRAFAQKLHRKIAFGGGKSFGQMAAHALAQLGVELLARQVNNGAHIALEIIGAGKQAHARALVERHHALGGVGQRRCGDFKQFIARISLQHKMQHFVFIAAADKVAMLNHILAFLAQNGNIPHAG